mgnify:FL=1
MSRILEKLADQHEERMINVLYKLEEDVVKEVTRATKGQLVSQRLAIQLRPKIKELVENNFLNEADLIINEEYNKIAKEVLDTFGEMPIPNKFKSLTEANLSTINALKFQSYSGFEDIGERFIKVINDELYQSTIAGRPYEDMVSNIRGHINGVYKRSNQREINELVDFINENKYDNTKKVQVENAVRKLHTQYASDRAGNNLRRYAGQIAHDSVMQFHGQFTIAKAKESGLTHFTYTGTLVRDSRDWCRGILGKTYTEKQIRELWNTRSWNGKANGDPFIVRGGYRCRHTWIPTDPSWGEETLDEVPAEIEQDKDFVGFGNTIPDELEWHSNSWNNSPTNITNLISLFPPLRRVDRSEKGGAYADRDLGVRPINQTKNKDAGNVYINMRGTKGDNKIKDVTEQEVWRHEYGHCMDMQMNTVLKKKPKFSEYNANALKSSSPFADDLYSANFTDEIIEDRKALSKKFRDQPSYRETREMDLDNAEILQKEGFISKEFIDKTTDPKTRGSFYNYEPLEKKIDDAFLDKYLTDGQAFTKKELKAIIFSNKGKDKIFKYNFRKRGVDTQSHVANMILKINSLNKRGSIRGEGEGTLLHELQKLAQATANENTRYEIAILSDYLGAITNEAIGFGHGKDYYSKFRRLATGVTTGHGTEAFANYIAILGDKDLTKIYKPIMDRYTPKTMKQFDKGIKNLQEQVK